MVTPESSAFYDRVLERVRAIPGVARAGIASRLPFEVWHASRSRSSGRPAPEPGKEPQADFNEVDAGVLDHAGHPPAARPHDRGARHRVDAVGRRGQQDVRRSPLPRRGPARQGDPLFDRPGGGDKCTVEEPQPREIVGVVADVAYPSFFTETPAAVYVPFRQHVWQYGREDEWIHTRKALVVRAAVDPLTPRALDRRRACSEVDRDQAAHDFMTMDAARRRARRPSPTAASSPRSSRRSASLAILLAMVGVYGVMSWVVSQRTSEFGDPHGARRARPATSSRCCSRQSLRPIVIGLVLGALGGFGLSRALNAMFWQMTSADPLIFSAIAVLMLAAALAAAWLPVHRVTRIDPQQALRYE